MEAESESLAPKAFDIFEDISNYDPKEAPSNGYEYLYQVILESSKTPHTVVASINPEKLKKNQTYYVDDSKDETVDKNYIPSEEWQISQVNHFRVVKNLIPKMKDCWKRKQKLPGRNIHLPETDNEEEWLKFCLESDPLLSTLFAINQTGLDQLIGYHSNWLKEKDIVFSHKTIMWLYSMFACLEEPLSPSTFANLRNIVRMAKQKRASLENANDEMLIALNVIISIATRYYKQTDLGD